MPSGYHRDYQVLKELLFPALDEVKDLLHILYLTVSSLGINQHIADNELYRYTTTVDQVNKMVMEGVPFREAYRVVADSIRKGEYKVTGKIKHTHEGSMDNLCNAEITKKMHKLYQSIQYEKVEEAYRVLLGE
jgi:argininosuccinate lyase